MRLTIVLLGHTFDLSLEPTATEDAETCSLDGGTTSAYPVGFTVWPVPEEIAAPQHCPSWDEPEEQA